MNKNYQKELERILEELESESVENKADLHKEPPRLLLHSCCAPCSSYVLEYLRKYFRITVFYYNPNISEVEEYSKRVAEQKRLIEAFNAQAAGGIGCWPVSVLEETYKPEEFYAIAAGRENCPEGGERCLACYELRLARTAMRAAEEMYDYFATTLTISPLKHADKLNEIGERLAGIYGVSWLYSDFKKKNGYRRSVELSEEYGLYRQDYCGCVFSMAEREKQKREAFEGETRNWEARE